MGIGAAAPAKMNRCLQWGAGRDLPHLVPRLSKPEVSAAAGPPEANASPADHGRRQPTQIVAALAQTAAASTARAPPPPRFSALRPPPTSPGSRRSDARAPAEPRLPPIGRSPSEISSGSGQPLARAVAISAHPTSCSTRSNPHAAIGRDGWNRLCTLPREVKRGVSTNKQKPGKKGEGGGFADDRGERHLKAVVAWREDRRHGVRR